MERCYQSVAEETLRVHPITRSRHAQRKARSAHAPLGSRAVRQPRPLAGAPFGRCAVAFLRGCLLRGCLCAVAYRPATRGGGGKLLTLSLIHISEPTRLLSISYAVFCLKK